jgi:hypothetical protein
VPESIDHDKKKKSAKVIRQKDVKYMIEFRTPTPLLISVNL